IANGHSPRTFGGGIYNDGTLEISSCTLSGNTATAGAGIYNSPSGALTVSNSTFFGNRGVEEGGGIQNHGTLTVSNSTFLQNAASDGGGILTRGVLTVNNCIFSGNSSVSGGAIAGMGTLTVSNSTLSGNSGDSG